VDRRAFFDEQAAAWDAREGAAQEEALRRVVAEARVQKGHRVLDTGTGTGVLVPFIVDGVGPTGLVLAIDISRAMLAQARAKVRATNVWFAAGDVHHLPAAAKIFHRAICNAAFPHFEDRARGLREMIQALLPGGILVVSHPIGREAVNARHRAAGGTVSEDRVPPARIMEGLLAGAGLERVAVIDEPEFYLARGEKPR
jgi:ubiquinone/menaquinone biosynthesis C-methylase UbiE